MIRDVTANNIIGPVLIEKTPDWVRRCADRFSRARLSPIYDGLQGDEITPFKAGLAFGLIKVGDQVGPVVKELAKSVGHSKAVRATALELFYGPQTARRVKLKKGGFSPASLEADVRRVTRKFNAIEMSEFHRGAAVAYSSVAGLGRSNDATNIYLFLAINWQVVARLQSVTELRTLLVKVFGDSLVGGDNKRIGQICRRVGLKFRGRGRPLKNASARLAG